MKLTFLFFRLRPDLHEIRWKGGPWDPDDGKNTRVQFSIKYTMYMKNLQADLIMRASAT